MELNLIHRIERSKIGIATSVARELDYSWIQTIQWAQAENLQFVQLFINPETLKEDLTTFLKNGRGLKAFFHLPANAGEATVQYALHTLNSFCERIPIILIQHQQWAATVERFLDFFPEMVFAVENDRPQSEPLAFWQFLKEHRISSAMWAVLDIPRFYHQAPADMPFKEITAQIDRLIFHLKEHRIPFLVHAIDQSKQGGERQHWTPFLQGALPWVHFIKVLQNSSDLLKCFVFEYEDWNRTKEGIRLIAK